MQQCGLQSRFRGNFWRGLQLSVIFSKGSEILKKLKGCIRVGLTLNKLGRKLNLPVSFPCCVYSGQCAHHTPFPAPTFKKSLCYGNENELSHIYQIAFLRCEHFFREFQRLMLKKADSRDSGLKGTLWGWKRKCHASSQLFQIIGLIHSPHTGHISLLRKTNMPKETSI